MENKKKKVVGKPFEKGVSGNPSGRPAGIPNKVTSQTKELFQTITEGESDRIQKAIARLYAESPKDYLKVILDMTNYFLPKMQATSVDANVKGEIEEKHNFQMRFQQMYGYSKVAEEQMKLEGDEYEVYDPDAEDAPDQKKPEKDSATSNLFGGGKGGGYAMENSDTTFFGKEVAKKRKAERDKKQRPKE